MQEKDQSNFESTVTFNQGNDIENLKGKNI